MPNLVNQALKRVRPFGRSCKASVLALAALAGCAVHMPEADNQVLSAWVQHSADQGLQVRAISSGSVCPSMQTAGSVAMPMSVRVGPANVAPRAGSPQPDAKPASFPVLTCEAPWPVGRASVRVGNIPLSEARPDVRRIVLIGDTGCRLKSSESAYQACNDPLRWPFAAVARSAAAMHADLVIHVGDYHYRESPCPTDRPDCAGSPWGYGHDAWEADLFQPAAPLLASAPWLFVRGNHESCNRAGQGWFRYLDARPWSEATSCNDAAQDEAGDFTEPFAVPLSAATQVIVFDSSRVSARAYGPQDRTPGIYTAQLRRVAELARRLPHSLFINHHPVLGYAPGNRPEAPSPTGAGLRSVMDKTEPGRLFAAGIDTVISGHVHLFQALGFASDHPSALVVGNSGSQMEGEVSRAAGLSGSPAPGARVEAFATQPGFGFATLDRSGEAWTLSAWSVGGELLHTCALEGARLSCATVPQ